MNIDEKQILCYTLIYTFTYTRIGVVCHPQNLILNIYNENSQGSKGLRGSMKKTGKR